MRQNEQLVIVNDFNVVVLRRNPEGGNTESSLDAGAGKCLWFNVCVILF